MIADLLICLIINSTTKKRAVPIRMNMPDIGTISFKLASSIFRKNRNKLGKSDTLITDRNETIEFFVFNLITLRFLLN